MFKCILQLQKQLEKLRPFICSWIQTPDFTIEGCKEEQGKESKAKTLWLLHKECINNTNDYRLYT